MIIVFIMMIHFHSCFAKQLFVIVIHALESEIIELNSSTCHYINLGKLTKGEGSVRLTSSFG
jgi:hypothetical protein